MSHFLLYLQNYKEFEADISGLQSEKYGLSFDVKQYTTSSWTLGDENVIGIRAFRVKLLACFVMATESRLQSAASSTVYR